MQEPPRHRLTIADVPGLRVGHATDLAGITGCTVVLAGEPGAVAGVDVRGPAPGTRETDLLKPTALIERVHAVCLSGGSAFGLAAADGVMAWLEERGIGFATDHGPVPIVPTAVLYDLGIGDPDARPGPDAGRAACDAAAADGEAPLEGSVGAGTGAIVGKLAGSAQATKGGVGSSARLAPGGAMVGALAVTNPFGGVVDADGRVLAGARDPAGGHLDPLALLARGTRVPFGNTTLAVVATDAALDRAQCRHLATVSHDALARAIVPVHTPFDGDVVFAMATGDGSGIPPSELLALGAIAVEVLADAIRRSVIAATSLGGVPAARDG